MNKKIILVTGGNRGIGLEICRQLATAGHTVIMGSRDPVKGEKAAACIGQGVVMKQLDVTNDRSVEHLAGFVENEFGKLDILINNAGVGANQASVSQKIAGGLSRINGRFYLQLRPLLRKIKAFLGKTGFLRERLGAENTAIDVVKRVMGTNFYGPWRMINAFLPLLEKSMEGRIINISSGMGQLAGLNGNYAAYRMSKSSLNALTIMFSHELEMKNIKVNAMDPGWVRTDMGGPDAPRDVTEGADTAVWLATAEGIPTGKFFRDRQVINW
jgi:NAD(P)-dependent dehydrogenase (short-subunit alcohol dehydrogenase family)